MKKRSQLTKSNIIILITVFGFILRIHNLASESFWFDESISSIAAIALCENGTPVLPSGFYYGRAILNTFLIAVSFSFFGVNEFAGRFPAVIFGTLTILLVYHIGFRWGNQRTGLIAAILVAFSVWEIAWSRQARMYQQLQFFYLLSLYLFFEYVDQKNKKHFYLLVASFAATILSHVFGYSLIVVFSFFLSVLFLKHKSSADIIRKRSTLCIFSIFLLLFLLVYERGVISHIIHTQVNYFDEYVYLLKKNLGFSLLLAVPGATVLMHRDWRKGILLIISIIIPYYVIFFHVLLFGIRYLYFVIPLFFILAAFFLDFCIGYISQATIRIPGLFNSGKASGKMDAIDEIYHRNDWDEQAFKRPEVTVSPFRIYSLVVVMIMVLMYFSPAFTFLPKDEYDLGPNAPRSDFRKAYSYVSSNMQPEDIVISAWTAPAQFYLGKNDYWLTFNVDGTGYGSFTVKNGSRDKYADSIVLNSTDMLENVTLDHKRGWIVVDVLAWYKICPESRDFIENEARQELRDPTIRVYMWDHTNNSIKVYSNSSCDQQFTSGE